MIKKRLNNTFYYNKSKKIELNVLYNIKISIFAVKI